MKILLVEDDQATAAAVAAALTVDHYSVNVATDGKTALALALAFAYDLVLLDVLIPEIDGISVCRHLRSQGDATPILLLTAKDASRDRVLGLDAGADDYLVKPFHMPELLARIRALLRRATAQGASVITWENLRLDSRTGEIHYGETLLKLTPKEHGILELLLCNPRQIFSRSVILDKLWDVTECPGEDTVTTHVKALRQKLKSAGAPKDLIESVYGLGYRFQSLERASPAVLLADPPGDPLTDRVPSAAPPTQQSVDRIMEELWGKFKAGFMAQVDGLLAVAIALATGNVTPEQYQQACLDVHKLKGGLGIFGYPQGSVLALEIEQVLRSPLPLSSEQIIHLKHQVQALQAMLSQPPGVGATAIAPQTAVLPSMPSIMVVAQDLSFTTALAIAVADRYHLEIVGDPIAARHTLEYRMPAVLLLDFTLFEAQAADWTWLQAVATRIPVIGLTDSPTFMDRVQVGRLGGRACLPKSVGGDQLFQTIQRLCPAPRATPGRVLAVDDDPTILALLKTLLEPWGLFVTTLEDPQRFWSVFTACTPDLLVLDIEMPSLSGIELCRVVRDDDGWGDRPILFLTAHHDDAQMYAAFAAGADDYIQKPIRAPELVTRIVGRLDRRQLAKHHADLRLTCD
jgi:DNA-binding response OmpR family regulator